MLSFEASFRISFSLSSAACRTLLQEMSKDIGAVNIYDIYDDCNMNLSSRNPSRAKYVNGSMNLYVSSE